MNRYHESMEHCAPPPELEEQLREAVLSAEPEPQARTAVYRPRGFFRKALLAAVLAVVLTLSVGAAVLVDWDDIFSDQFGPEAAETPMAEKAFQPGRHVISVCDDVARDHPGGPGLREEPLSDSGLPAAGHSGSGSSWRWPMNSRGLSRQNDDIDLPDGLLLRHRRHFLGGAEGRRPGQVGGHWTGQTTPRICGYVERAGKHVWRISA